MTTPENKNSSLEKASTDIEFDSDQDFLDEFFGLKPKLEKPLFRRSSRKGMLSITRRLKSF